MAYKDRENFEGNQKPSVLADDVYEAMFGLGDTDAKSGPDSIVDIGDDTDIAIDIARGLTHGSRTKMESELQNEVNNGIANNGDKLMEVQFVSDVDIDLFTTRGDDEKR